MAFVKVTYHSCGNKGGTGSHDINGPSTASSAWKEWLPDDSIWSSITQGPSTRNPGPCNHMSEFTSSSAEIPLVTKSARLSTPGQWDHLSFKVNVWISLMRLEVKVFQREGTLLIQDRTIMESVQQMYSTSSGSLRALNRQPSNSRRGNVVCFRGVILDLAMTRDDTIELSQSSARKYTQAP